MARRPRDHSRTGDTARARIKAHADGDAWPSSFASHRPAVLGFLIRRSGNRDEAEDLTQETFVRALASGNQLRDERCLRAYLLRIARNLLIDHLRKNQRTVVRDRQYRAIGGPYGSESSRAPDPETDLAAQEFGQRLQDELDRLPDQQRVAFEQGVVLGRPYREIADETGWSIGKVKINVFRARKVLIGQLREYREEMA